MIPSSLRAYIKENSSTEFTLSHSQRKLYVLLALIVLFSGILIQVLLHFKGVENLWYYLPLPLLFWGPVIFLIVYRVNQGSLSFDIHNQTIRFKESRYKDYTTVPFKNVLMRIEQIKGLERPDIIEFRIKGDSQPIYRLHLDTKEQGLYDDLVLYLKSGTNHGIDLEIADIKPESGTLESIAGVVIAIVLFFLLAGFLFLLPAALMNLTNTGAGGYCMFFLLIFMLMIGINVKNGINSKKWPIADGTIVSSGVAESNSSESGSRRYQPEVVYTYTVNERIYTGRTVAFYDCSSGIDTAKAFIDTLPINEPLMVYYHPGKPYLSVLKPGIDKSSVFVLFFLFALSLVAAFFAFRT
jgi:Protein of unknown function (DUF3592)